MNFQGKIALITGAAVGIGRATALEFGKAGAALVLLDIDRSGLERVKQELSEYTDKVMIYDCDVSRSEQIDAVLKDALDKMGNIHILVNNAAIWRSFKPFTELDMTEWQRLFDVNVTATAYITKLLLPGMLNMGYGRIINVASVAGVYGNANMVCYSATKGAVIAFTKALAKEVAGKGVLVNAISPGSVSPSSNEDIDYTEPSNLSFIGRTGSDRENANLILFLASDQASYISAQNIQIDGCRKKQ